MKIKKNTYIAIYYIIILLVFAYNRETASILLFASVIVNIFTDRVSSIYVLALIIPFYGVFHLDNLGVLLPYLFIAFILKNHQIVTKSIFVSDRYSIAWWLFSISIFISSIIYGFSFRNILEVLVFIFIFLSIRIIVNQNNIDVVNLIFFYVIGLVISGVVGTQIEREVGVWVSNQYKNRFVACMGDPNYLSRALLFGFSYLLTIFLSNRLDINRKFQVRSIIGIVALFVLLLLTLSKMGIVVFTLLLLLFAFIKFNFRNFGYMVLFVIFLFFVVNEILPRFEIYEVLINRFLMADSVDTLTTNRSLLQSSALLTWFNSDSLIAYLFGFGIDSSRIVTKDVLKEGNVLHSIYAQTIVEQGLLGFILLMNLIFVKYRNITRINVLPFTVFFITGFALSGFFYWDQILFYILFDKNFSYQETS